MHAIFTILSPRLWLPPSIVALLLIIVAQSDFLSFHTVAQRFAVMISFLMFAFVWATRDYRKNNFLLFLACGYFWIGSLDLVHVLVYERIDLLIEANANLSVQVWISARYSEALLLLAAPFAAARKRNGYLLLTAFGIVAVGLVALIFSGQFPTVFVEGKGLTDFKIYSEYLIILILAFAIFVLIRHPSDISKDEKVLISASIILTMCAELLFTFYVSFGDLSNLAGHILKTFSYWFIFQAIVIFNLKKPFSELHTLQEYNRSLFEDSVTGMALCKTDGTFVDVNPAFARLTGYTVDELKSGMSYWELTPEHHLEQEKSVIENFTITGELDPFEKEYLCKDGSLIPVRISGKAIIHDDETYNLSSVEDITERQKLQKTTMELEFQKTALDEHAIVSFADAKGDITYVNDKFCEASGYSREELLGENHRLIKSDEHSDEFYKDMWRTIENGKPWSGEIKNRTKDGGYYWVLITIVPFLDEQGQPIRYIAIRSDITERKDAERLMHRFKTTVDLTQDAIFMAALDTMEIFFANEAASKHTGYSKEELCEMNPANLNFKLSASELREKMRPLLDGSAVSETFQTEHRHKSGRLIPVEVKLQCIKPSDGEPHLLSIVRDITDRKAADLQIAQFRSTLDSIQDPVYMFWPDTLEYFYVNQAAVDFSGISAEDYLGHTPMEIFTHFELQEFHERYEALYSGELEALTYESEHIDNNGELVSVDVLAQIIQPEGEKAHIVEIARDISERKAIDKAKSEFISTVSHELRTPLTSIKGSLGLIETGVFGKLPDKVLSLISIAHTNSDRLSLLIDDILDAEQISARMMKFQMKPTSLNILIEEAIIANEGYADKYDVTLVSSPDDPPFVVNVDRDRMMQVMANLLSNAVKFSHRGGKVKVSVSRHGENIRVAVKDYGCGIPEEARATIFDRFTQADSSDQRAKGGTGLGLNIAKAVVEGHGGTIGFTSDIGKGTTFYVDLEEVVAEKKTLDEL